MRCLKASRPTAAATAREPRNCSLGQTSNLATPDFHHVQAAPIRIDVSPTASGGKWVATFNGETICVVSLPLIASARILLARSFDPACTIEMWHQGAAAWALRGKLGAVAAVVADGEKNPQRRARNGSPVAPLGTRWVSPPDAAAERGRP